MIATIYKCTNLVSGKSYIGFTTNYDRRILQHAKGAAKGVRKVLYDAIRSYGQDNFEWSIVYQSKDVGHTKNVMEPYFITLFESLVPTGYNVTLGGDGCVGYVWSDELKSRHSDIIKSRFTDIEFYEKHVREFVERTQTTDVKRRRVETRAGYTHSQETRDKISKSTLGKSVSEETAKRLSESLTGRSLSEDHRLNISKGNVGKIVTDEHRENISKAKKGKPLTEAHKAALRKAKTKKSNDDASQRVPKTAIPVEIRGKSYQSKAHACREIGVTWYELCKMLKDQ